MKKALLISLLSFFLGFFYSGSGELLKNSVEVLSFSGVVDGLDILRIKDKSFYIDHLKNKRILNCRFNFKEGVGRGNYFLKKIGGRGNVSIYQQPSEFNDYLLSVIIDDTPFGGSDNYSFKVMRDESVAKRRKVLFRWYGVVDKEERIYIDFSKRKVDIKHLSGSKNISGEKFSFENKFKMDRVFDVVKLIGRGGVSLYDVSGDKVIVNIFDPYPGADSYEFEIIERGVKDE